MLATILWLSITNYPGRIDVNVLFYNNRLIVRPIGSITRAGSRPSCMRPSPWSFRRTWRGSVVSLLSQFLWLLIIINPATSPPSWFFTSDEDLADHLTDAERSYPRADGCWGGKYDVITIVAKMTSGATSTHDEANDVISLGLNWSSWWLWFNFCHWRQHLQSAGNITFVALLKGQHHFLRDVMWRALVQSRQRILAWYITMMFGDLG